MNGSDIRRSVALGVAVLIVAALPACGGKGRTRAEGRDGRTPTTPSGADGLQLELAWSWSSPPPGSAGMPVADGEGIALTAGREELFLLDAGGAVRWRAERVGLRDVAPALTDELVVAATDDGVVAYDRATGRPRWETALGGERANTPVVVGAKAVVTTWEGSLVAIDLSDGVISWRTMLGGAALGPASSSPEAGTTAVATFDSGGVAGAVAVDAVSGRQRWSVSLPAGGVSAPAIVSAANTVVVVAADAAAHGLSLDDGSERWRRAIEGAGSPEVPPLPLPDGTVLVGHRRGGMALIDARDGTVRWDASSNSAAVRGGPAGPGPHGWFSMPLHNGTVLFADPDDVEQQHAPALATGVAVGPGGLLLLSTGQGDDNGLFALTGW